MERRTDMGTFLQAITDGVLQGGVYGLMAVGLTLIFGVLDLINIAQGILVVLGAYLSYVLWTHLHIDVFAGLLITIPAMFILGVAIQYLFIRPLRGRERTSMSLLACYAVAIIIEGILYQVFGSNYVSINDYWTSPQAEFKIFGYYLPYIYLLGFALAVIFVAAIYLMLYRTQFGRSVRATMQDHTAARLIGIDVNRVAALTFGIGVGVTAAGGMVFGTLNSFNPNTGYDLISRLLAIVILGGMGSIVGALGAAVLVITLASMVTVTHVGVFVLLYVGSAVAWNIFSGFTGYISLGAAVFFGTGVYTVALMSKHLNLAGGVVFALYPLAGLVAAVVAVPFGLIALRVRRHTFVVVTIAVFFIFQLMASNFSWTGAATGIFPPFLNWDRAM